MISEYQAKKFCKEDISKIKNYEKAIADTTQTLECHHMTETWWNCSKHFSEEHRRKLSEAHNGMSRSEDTRKKMSEAAKRRWARKK